MTAPKEKPENLEITLSTQGDKKSNDKKQPPSTDFLQEFLAELRIQALMKKETRGSSGLTQLVVIEQKLASSDAKEKGEALIKLREYGEERKRAEEMGSGLSLVDIVGNPGAAVDERVRGRVQEIAASVDGWFAKLEKGEQLGENQLEGLNEQMELLAVGLEINGGRQAMEELVSRAELVNSLVRARTVYIDENAKFATPLAFWQKEFEPGEDGEILKLRGVGEGEKTEKKAIFEKYKAHVARELLSGDRRELEKLEPEELLQRLEEATYWQANQGDLFGRADKKHRGVKEYDKLRGLLVEVEAQYTAELERRIGIRLGAEGDRGRAVRLALQEKLAVSKKKKLGGRSKAYDFGDGVPAGRSKYEVFENNIKQQADEIENKGRLSVVSRDRIKSTDFKSDVGWGADKSDVILDSSDAVENTKARRRKSVQDKLHRIEEIQAKLGVEFSGEEFLGRVGDVDGRARLLDEAMATGKLNPEQLEFYRRFLGEMGGSLPATEELGFGSRLVGVQRELEKLAKEAEKTGRYAPFMIKLQAYIDRVGLRETSSDFQFAIVLRQAKEIISRLNEDAGGKFDLWQESQFLPSITSLDEKTYYSVSPKVMNHIRAKMELEGPIANWLGMQVEGEGGKKVLSTASFFQLLQSREGAMRTIMAPINSADSNILNLWVEHVWGEDAKWVVDPVPEGQPKKIHIEIPDGDKLRKIYDVDVSYFSMDGAARPDHDHTEKMEIADFLDQSMWMAHYASKMWWYSGEWENFAKDFPGEMLPQANKRLLSIGSAFRDYGLQYGKFEKGYSEIAKAGVLLQDFRTYKASDVITANIRHLLYDLKVDAHEQEGQRGTIPVAKWDRGEKIGKTIFKALSSYAHVTEDYKPLSSLRSVDQIQLMGHLGDFANPEARWEWYRKQQNKLGRKGVPTSREIAELRNKSFESLRGSDEAWVVQAEQIDILFEDLREQRELLDKLGLTAQELAPLIDRQVFLKTGEHRVRGGETLDEFLRTFEYNSVLSYSELRKGTDPLDYQNYNNAKMDAAKKALDVFNPLASLQDISEMVGIMKGYMPPDQIDAWLAAYRQRQIQLRTFQSPWEAYEISMSDKEEWEMKRKRGEEEGERPDSISGYNPAMFSIKDERGDTWNVTGADGFRVTRKRKRWGNHMKDEYDVPALSSADIEVGNKLWVAKRWLAKDKAEAILEDSFGVGKTINTICKRMGWNENSTQAKFVKKWGSKALLLLRQHPLFDDPKWAFWSILNELVEYGGEVQKEMLKEMAK